MDIPKVLLNSTDKITKENQKMEMQAFNQHPVARETREQIDSLRSRQSVRLESQRGLESSEGTDLFGHRGSIGAISKGIVRVFFSR
jgi:hypothetical protein